MSVQDVVRSLLIPVKGGQFLLPSAVVAEVTPHQNTLEKMENQPAWLAGIFLWRNQRVPLLALEEILGISAADTAREYYTVVLYGLDANQILPFYAFLATDVPRALAMKERDINLLGDSVPQGIAHKVQVQYEDAQEAAWLPDVTYFENLLRKSQPLVVALHHPVV
ncbi:MAG: hypothetical protein RIS84_1196 [Pseudomonadota bacterium]|jgi:chemosensory pili system protein ChpC